MRSTHSGAARRGATGVCRKGRSSRGARRPEWVRPFRRLRRALDASVRSIDAALRSIGNCEECASRRPVRASRHLVAAHDCLVTASVCLARAAHALAATNACLGRDREGGDGAPELIVRETLRWISVAARVTGLSEQVSSMHDDVAEGIVSGALVPEPDFEVRRPRIVLAPRPAPVRAFLRARQPRVTDRIAVFLLRRRQTDDRLPAQDIPPRTCRGRAPPPSSIALH
jgi:hypothetical protein